MKENDDNDIDEDNDNDIDEDDDMAYEPHTKNQFVKAMWVWGP